MRGLNGGRDERVVVRTSGGGVAFVFKKNCNGTARGSTCVLATGHTPTSLAVPLACQTRTDAGNVGALGTGGESQVTCSDDDSLGLLP